MDLRLTVHLVPLSNGKNQQLLNQSLFEITQACDRVMSRHLVITYLHGDHDACARVWSSLKGKVTLSSFLLLWDSSKTMGYEFLEMLFVY